MAASYALQSNLGSKGKEAQRRLTGDCPEYQSSRPVSCFPLSCHVKSLGLFECCSLSLLLSQGHAAFSSQAKVEGDGIHQTSGIWPIVLPTFSIQGYNSPQPVCPCVPPLFQRTSYFHLLVVFVSDNQVASKTV